MENNIFDQMGGVAAIAVYCALIALVNSISSAFCKESQPTVNMCVGPVCLGSSNSFWCTASQWFACITSLILTGMLLRSLFGDNAESMSTLASLSSYRS